MLEVIEAHPFLRERDADEGTFPPEECSLMHIKVSYFCGDGAS